MRYMLDTNICIDLIKNHPPQVLRRLQALNQG
jgi:tRNA(fMet)-specific endonuclease VapC